MTDHNYVGQSSQMGQVGVNAPNTSLPPVGRPKHETAPFTLNGWTPPLMRDERTGLTRIVTQADFDALQLGQPRTYDMVLEAFRPVTQDDVTEWMSAVQQYGEVVTMIEEFSRKLVGARHRARDAIVAATRRSAAPGKGCLQCGKGVGQ